MTEIGRRHWAIAEGYIPSESSFSERALISHETACILNAGDRDAHSAVTLFFRDRDPVGPYRLTVSARRTLHLRFNDLEDPQPVPRDTDYASAFESDVPIVVQHTLDGASVRGDRAGYLGNGGTELVLKPATAAALRSRARRQFPVCS
jgi:hypothetical protein